MVTATLFRDIPLSDFLQNPIERMEWVNGELVEITGMTLRHGEIQSKLSYYWRGYLDSDQQGGKVYTEAPCRTSQQVRRPDVAYLPPDLVAQYGNEAVLPQSFPLIAEVASPTDEAEALFVKAQEYLSSGCLEVWLVFPDSQWVLIATPTQLLGFVSGSTVSTQNAISGFSLEIAKLFD
jgi:Uma2 family endonuclease